MCSAIPPTPALPLKGGGRLIASRLPSPLEGEGRVGGEVGKECGISYSVAKTVRPSTMVRSTRPCTGRSSNGEFFDLLRNLLASMR